MYILYIIAQQCTGPWKSRVATVLGQRGAWMFNTENAVRSTAPSAAAASAVQGVSLTRVSKGDVLDLTTYTITPAGT